MDQLAQCATLPGTGVVSIASDNRGLIQFPFIKNFRLWMFPVLEKADLKTHNTALNVVLPPINFAFSPKEIGCLCFFDGKKVAVWALVCFLRSVLVVPLLI